MLCGHVVPIAAASSPGCLVVSEAVLEVVEHGKLVACENVTVGLGFDFGP